ncbi:MAG TPA: NADH-quinone oxidoreductase subunit NuoH [Ktedonobacterales bacterium]|nr:NADH-quinone oxidoreductase subunit NuoH [Ktedonobacterales bacterium]
MNDVVQNIIHFVVTFLFAVFFLMTAASLLVWSERKVQAFMQDRWGPLHYGPQGLLLAILDPMKLLLKEDLKPKGTDNIVFRIAPMVFFAPVVTAFVVLPFSPYLTASALGTGIIYYVALSSIDVVGIFMAGWGSNNKYALIGGLRSAAQMISYELPLVLALVGVVMLTSVVGQDCVGTQANLNTCGVGSISFTQITAAQMRPGVPWLWFVLLQPLGLAVYYICGLAETNRTPFDLPEAESELVAGYLTEYSGLRWAMFFLGEYGNMTIVSAVATALFLGGWSGPGTAIGFWVGLLGTFWGNVVFNIIAVFWFVTKMVVLLLVFQWIRATLPRLRADQLMRFAWLYLIPLTLANIIITGGLLLLPLDPPVRLGISAAANWLLLILVLVTFRRVTGLSAASTVPRWLRRQVAATAAAKAAATRTAQSPEPASAGRR